MKQEWWCVIVYNPQALGLNVFGLMKWIPYSPTLLFRQDNRHPDKLWKHGRIVRLGWFVMTSAKLTRSHVNQSNLL